MCHSISHLKRILGKADRSNGNIGRILNISRQPLLEVVNKTIAVGIKKPNSAALLCVYVYPPRDVTDLSGTGTSQETTAVNNSIFWRGLEERERERD